MADVSMLAIEIHDDGLIAATRDGRPGRPSPGVALIDDSGILTGEAAQARARIQPRKIHDRFWRDLDSSPLGRPFPGDLTRADLAHAHLAAVWEPLRSGVESVLLAVPPTFGESRLGLLLGIAEACEMPVRGIVDAALAAASTVCGAGGALLLDLELHRASVSVIRGGADLVRTETRVHDAGGLAALRDRWVKRIAADFVRETRFDPLHRGETEQELYVALPGLLDRLITEERHTLALALSGRKHAIELSRSAFVETAEQLYDPLVELVRGAPGSGEPRPLLLTARCAGLPGLVQRLGRDREEAEIHLLASDAALRGTLEHVAEITEVGSAPSFVNCFTLDSGTQGASAVPGRRETSSGEAPTHLLLAERAFRLDAGPWLLGTAVPPGSRGIALTGEVAGISRTHCRVRREEERVVVEDLSRYGTFLNGRKVDGSAELRCGDRLRLGVPGIELRLIGEDEGDGST